MKKSDCYQLGYIAKLHGFKGEVSLFLDVTNPEEYQQIDKVLIEINGQLTPFFIQSYQLKNKGFAAVKFEGVDSENDARVLLRKKAFMPLTDLPQLGTKNFYDHEIVDFELIDTRKGSIGRIVQIIDLPVNPLIQVDAKGKEVLIPLIGDLVQHVDRQKKTLTVTCPDGLLDLYL